MLIRENLLNYIAIVILSSAFIYTVTHFEEIAVFITKFFRL